MTECLLSKYRLHFGHNEQVGLGKARITWSFYLLTKFACSVGLVLECVKSNRNLEVHLTEILPIEKKSTE